MSDRLRLAIEKGHIALPEGRVLVINAEANTNLSYLDKGDTLIWTRSASAHARLEADGWTLGTPEGDFAGAIVFLPRARDAARASLLMAQGHTTGLIIIDGPKTNGVDAFYRELRKRATVSDAWSKAHGKVFTATDVERYEDWPVMEPAQDDDGWWRAPGVFSGDGIDKASAFLAESLPKSLPGAVADLGAGWGYLSGAMLKREDVTRLHLVEDDRLALEAATRNIKDPRAEFHAADALMWQPPAPIDHVITNPPFHAGRKAEPQLGQAFIRAAARILKPKGQLWLVANRHLPYESTLEDAFRTIELRAETPSFKIFHATSPKRRKA